MDACSVCVHTGPCAVVCGLIQCHGTARALQLQSDLAARRGTPASTDRKTMAFVLVLQSVQSKYANPACCFGGAQLVRLHLHQLHEYHAQCHAACNSRQQCTDFLDVLRLRPEGCVQEVERD
jgi:hypothetical protein